MTAVAIHVDQLWFAAPGGIGTYVRHLVPALARSDPELRIVPFRARFSDREPPEPWLAGYRVEELRWSIRALYPAWDLLGRPSLPPSLRAVELVHATNHAAIPPRAPGQRLVATVHDLAFLRFPRMFPPTWRALYRLGLRAAVRRADAILTPSRATAEDLVARTRVDPGRVHVTPLAAVLPEGEREIDRVLQRLRIRAPYVLYVGTLEPRKNLVRLVRAYRRIAGGDLPHALVLAGPLGWGHEPLLREIALPGPGEIALTGPLPEEDLDALYRGARRVLLPLAPRGFRAAGGRGDGPERADRHLAHVVPPRGRGRRRSGCGPPFGERDRRGPAPRPHRHRSRRAAGGGGPGAGRPLLMGGDRPPHAPGLPGGARAVKVSLVTTVLDARERIEGFLASLAAQTRAPDEVIVVDGGSTDGTLEVLRRAEGIRLIVEPGASIARGRNVAIAAAAHDVIAVTDADCELEPAWLERLLVPIEEGADVAMGAYRPVAETFFHRCLAAVNLPDPAEWDEATFMPSSRSIAFRRSAIEAVGGYPEWLEIGEDMYVDHRFRELGLDMRLARDAVVRWHLRPDLRSTFVAVLPVRAGGRDRRDAPRAPRPPLRRLRRSPLRVGLARTAPQARDPGGRGRLRPRAPGARGAGVPRTRRARGGVPRRARRHGLPRRGQDGRVPGGSIGPGPARRRW
ncbi:MAG: hypothetical protein KatS3mg014_0885 [Actinomycetota bacterium]|nr:MAG: hypothetical protein KatS3mg014_0885 [Actinomycetota bacterium]